MLITKVGVSGKIRILLRIFRSRWPAACGQRDSVLHGASCKFAVSKWFEGFVSCSKQEVNRSAKWITCQMVPKQINDEQDDQSSGGMHSVLRSIRQTHNWFGNVSHYGP